MSVDSKQQEPSDTDLGIISLYVNGNIIKSKISTLCVDTTSKLAQDLTNDEWLQEHKMKTEDGKVCYLIEQPAYAVKELVEYLRLKGIIDDDNIETIPKPNFGDATKEGYLNHGILLGPPMKSWPVEVPVLSKSNGVTFMIGRDSKL